MPWRSHSMSLRPFIDIAAGYVSADQPVAAIALLRSIEAVALLREPCADLAPTRRLLGRIVRRLGTARTGCRSLAGRR